MTAKEEVFEKLKSAFYTGHGVDLIILMPHRRFHDLRVELMHGEEPPFGAPILACDIDEITIVKKVS